MPAVMAGFLAELLEEVVARLGVDWLSGLINRTPSPPPGPSGSPSPGVVAVMRDPVNDQSHDHLDFHILLNSDEFLPLRNRKILRDAINRLPPEEQDRAEVLIGRIITEGRDGFFQERADGSAIKTVVETKKDGTKKETTEPVSGAPKAYPKGLEPERLLKKFLRDSTQNIQAVDLFLDGLMQKTRAQKAREAAEKASRKVSKFGKYLFWIFGGYVFILLASLIGAIFCFSIAVEYPEAISMFLWGLLCFVVFALASTPLALLFRKEGA